MTSLAVSQDATATAVPEVSTPVQPALSIGVVAHPASRQGSTAGIAAALKTDLEKVFPSVRWAPGVLTEHALVIPPAGAAELVEAVCQDLP